jgi:hypothetical protein
MAQPRAEPLIPRTFCRRSSRHLLTVVSSAVSSDDYSGGAALRGQWTQATGTWRLRRR